MDKNYDHKKYEKEVYDLWEKSDSFTPDLDSKSKSFTIIMPPPNANDPLHIGHAMFITIEDILIRYHRMLGDKTLWLPGTDHAGIETQFVFEKKLAKKDESRFDYDRETLYKMIWDYVQENSDVAVNQMKSLGASADWSRFKFTLEPKVVDIVLDTFKKLNDDDLIYRGERLINYCTKCGTGYSELEVEYLERTDPLYYMKYGPFTIATARPETKFRDAALAVNPKDKRYKDYIGQTMDIPGLLGDIRMTVVADPEVDPKFGTGAMKVTPAHDPHDFELGEKYNLPVTPIITTEGRMDFSWFIDSPSFESQEEKYKERAKTYHRMKVAQARALMVEHLKEEGLLVKVDEKYSHRVGTCYRCHSVLEPLPLPQFFIKTKPLAKKALEALDKKQTKIYGAGREKILRHWLTNIKDWNISRQIVWGIRIPVWYSIDENPNLRVTFLDKDKKIISGIISELIKKYDFKEIKDRIQKVSATKDANFIISKDSPGENFIQETDTFDTWFSSGQWPVVTLQANSKKDFDNFYPTSVMETGYDILPIWVMRMMILGIYMTEKTPFKDVYLHGLIRDMQGRKMSKSIGNVINPLDMVDLYGADALRMALVISSTPGQDKSVGENSIRAMRNFSNKVWNAARFVQGFEGDAKENKEFNSKIENISKEVTKHLENLRVGQASEHLFNEFWHWFCDQAIEEAKKGLISKSDLQDGLKTLLKLLHPFMPFVTEALWQEQKMGVNLISSEWPKI